jgi:adenine/guanine phosphoribosyltransferase-like PRPP-binding protein
MGDLGAGSVAAVAAAVALAAAVVQCSRRPTQLSPTQLVERMAPNVKGSGFEWKDPTRIYLDGAAFASTVDLLLEQLDGAGVEAVAGIDAAGYVLGAALASRLGVGFLCIRKGGSLPVETDEVTYSYSKGSGETQRARPPLAARRVLCCIAPTPGSA